MIYDKIKIMVNLELVVQEHRGAAARSPAGLSYAFDILAPLLLAREAVHTLLGG